jgi:hypothetical protein
VLDLRRVQPSRLPPRRPSRMASLPYHIFAVMLYRSRFAPQPPVIGISAGQVRDMRDLTCRPQRQDSEKLEVPPRISPTLVVVVVIQGEHQNSVINSLELHDSCLLTEGPKEMALWQTDYTGIQRKTIRAHGPDFICRLVVSRNISKHFCRALLKR